MQSERLSFGQNEDGLELCDDLAGLEDLLDGLDDEHSRARRRRQR